MLKDFETWAESLIDEIEVTTPAERENLSKQFEPTPENIKTLRIDPETAKAYFFIMGKMNDQSFVAQTIGEGLSQKKWNMKELQNRARALPDFFQAILEIANAMLSGKIKTTFARVEKKLPFFFKKAGGTSDFKFHASLNELRNIANGKMVF